MINPRQFDVAPIAEEEAKTFVLSHHYSGSFPARFRFGLFRQGQLCGTAVFSYPCNDLVLTNIFGHTASDAVELGRFVLLDSVPANGESWFLARAFEYLRAIDLIGVTTFSDPVPRRSFDGTLIHPGHIGIIFQAFNGVYLGRSTARTLRLLPDGTVLSDRAAQKLRKKERGWHYVAALLQKAGASPPDEEDLSAWAKYWVPRLTRPLRHPGNHRYAWPLQPLAKKLLPKGLPYPKFAPLFTK